MAAIDERAIGTGDETPRFFHAKIQGNGGRVPCQKNAAQAKAIVLQTIPLIPTQANWPSHNALQYALLTDKKFWPQQTKAALKPILEKYSK